MNICMHACVHACVCVCVCVFNKTDSLIECGTDLNTSFHCYDFCECDQM